MVTGHESFGEPEMLADYACVVGEGPLWHPDEGRLYWTDIPAGRLFRYDPATDAHEQCYDGPPVGGFTRQADGALLLFGEHGAVTLWHDGATQTVLADIPEERGTRFNDVIADPRGRVFCGTMATGTHPGRLYRLDTDGTLTTVLEGVGGSNGLGFTPDARQMYYTESGAREITVFDYDADTGALTNRRRFSHTPDQEGVPDGLTVDADGGVWSARWDGACLTRYDADGRETHRISFPARKVSSAAFGGPQGTDLYVTTAGGDQKATDGALAGALFRLPAVAPGLRGRPEFVSRVGL